MKELGYVRAQSLETALDLLNELGVHSRILAGGTDLVRYLGDQSNGVDRLVDVAEVPELKQIERTNEGCIRLGAAVTLTEILENQMLSERVPLLADGCRVVGGPQVRNQATPGGNVANGASCADIATILVCLEATALIAEPTGERRIAIADLLKDLPGELPSGSLIRAFEFLPPEPEDKTAFLRLAPRKAMSIARVSLAVMGGIDGDGRASGVRLAWGAVFPHPRRVPEIETMISGRAPSEPLFIEAAEAMKAYYMRESGDRWSAPFKQQVVTVFTERGLRQVLGEAS